MTANDLIDINYSSILELSTHEGINASAKEEIFGCIFGRDSFITILKLLKIISNPEAGNKFDLNPFIEISSTALSKLISLQGKETNLESGEEPGKFIHEYRKEKYEHLVNRPHRPWFLYPDKVLRNYDSIDSTPLGLIAIYKYWQVTKDDAFLLKALPSVESALNWIITYGDKDKDNLLEYELPVDRVHGGLKVQSWTDSKESLQRHDGTFPGYPIAPVEVQGYSWLALKLWSEFYLNSMHNYANYKKFSKKLLKYADKMRQKFNESFIFESEQLNYPAQALDGAKNQITTVTGNPLLLLWATYDNNGNPESILDESLIPHLVKRAFMPDMFDIDAGIRTMSTKSRTYISGRNSYHNGSFWPKLNGLAHEGLINWGYLEEAALLRIAAIKPLEFFGSPIELYVKNEDSEDIYLYRNERGQESCLRQAWSAASALDLLTQ